MEKYFKENKNNITIQHIHVSRHYTVSHKYGHILGHLKTKLKKSIFKNKRKKNHNILCYKNFVQTHWVLE